MSDQERKEYLSILAKVIEWALNNGIILTYGRLPQPAGKASFITIQMCKNGKCEFVEILSFDELLRPSFKKALMDTAYSLCLTGLEL